jgi:hypothetical protein
MASSSDHLLLVQHLQQQQQAEQLNTAQHSISQHDRTPAAAHAASSAGQQHAGQQWPSRAESWCSQHTAAVAQWRLLSESGQDETSANILSCSSMQQLLGVAAKLLKEPVSKWHYARLAAMAAVLAIQQPDAGSVWPQKQQQQQQADMRSDGGNGTSSNRTAVRYQHWQQEQQQQQQELDIMVHLACKVVEAVTYPCIHTGLPAVHTLHGPQLAETLHAVQLLLAQAISQKQQQQQQQQEVLQLQQQRLQQRLAAMPDALLLSAIHGCRTVDQLHSVLSPAGVQCNALHVKAGFVQLARLAPSSSSSSSRDAELWQRLLQLLPQQLSILQPHHCASILWSLGQLQPVFGSPISSGGGGGAMQQQLLQGALAGVERLNPRVCAQLLHGAAKLQLSVPPADWQALQQHTQQQLHLCDPQALSCMLWSLATLHSPAGHSPHPDWLQAFYSSSWKWLQPASASHNGRSTHQQQQQQQQHERWRSKDACSSFEPVELSALLTAACRLQLQPPSGWLAAVADSSSRQIASFQQQELGLLLWGFARLQYVPPRALLTAAAARAMQLGFGSFTPQSLSLLLYGMLRLLRWQPQQQQQQHGGQDGPLSDVQAVLLPGDAVQLDLSTALDLALLAWCLGLQAMPHRQQQQQQEQRQVGEQLLPSLLQAATARLLQQQFTPQGLGMLIWGCGTLLHAATASSSSTPPWWQQQQGQALSEAGVLAFVEAASLATTPHAKAFSGHELSLAVWGLGAVVAAADGLVASNSSSISSSSEAGFRAAAAASAAAECLDLLFCQLLDASDQLSNYQLAAAIQGFSWAQHPRGLDLLHVALQDRGAASRAQKARPQELLLLLRACIAYKYVPEGAPWGEVLAAVERMRHQLQGVELAQMLYLLGKLQVQSDRRTKQRAAQAAAAAATEAAAAAGSAWATQHEQRRMVRQQQQQRRQALQHVVLRPLVPDGLLGRLLVQAGGCLDQCSSTDVSLMMWGVSHLQQQQQHHHLQSQQRQPQPGHGMRAASSIPWGSVPAAPALFLSDQTAPLLSSVYPYTLQQLQAFAPGTLATLLYALHRLRARPEPSWLDAAAMQFTEQRLKAMDGQSLAVLALALAGLNWVPPQAWLGAFVRAVAAADRRGVLVTTWQRSCITNSLAALNPLAGHTWMSGV